MAVVVHHNDTVDGTENEGGIILTNDDSPGSLPMDIASVIKPFGSIWTFILVILVVATLVFSMPYVICKYFCCAKGGPRYASKKRKRQCDDGDNGGVDDGVENDGDENDAEPHHYGITTYHSIPSYRGTNREPFHCGPSQEDQLSPTDMATIPPGPSCPSLEEDAVNGGIEASPPRYDVADQEPPPVYDAVMMQIRREELAESGEF